MRPYPFVIPAGKSESVGVTGNYVRLASISGASSLVVKCLQTGEEVELESGDSAKLTAFKELFLSHSAAGDVTVKLYVGDNTEASSSKIAGVVSITPGGGCAALADLLVPAGLTADVAANAERLELHVYNPGANVIRWGSPAAAPGAAAGGVIPPGIVGVLPSSGAIRFYNGGAAGITLNLSEILK